MGLTHEGNPKEMNTMAIRLLVGSLLVILSASMAHAIEQAHDPGIAARVVEVLKVEVPKWIEESAVPGVAVAIVDDESILWQAVFGQTMKSVCNDYVSMPKPSKKLP
jgi:hypothetical protein